MAFLFLLFFSFFFGGGGDREGRGKRGAHSQESFTGNGEMVKASMEGTFNFNGDAVILIPGCVRETQEAKKYFG